MLLATKRRANRFFALTAKRLSGRLRRVTHTILSYVDFRKFSPKKRAHLVVNVIIGIAIVFCLQFLEQTRWGESTLDKFFDLFVRWESQRAAQYQSDVQKAPVLFVDIDHKTYQQWGEPPVTPRDKLAEILGLLHDAQAKVIVLDILLEGNDCPPGSDRELLSVLERIEADKRNATKVILPQRLGFQRTPKRNLFDALFDHGLLAGGSGDTALYRAVPSLSTTSSDNVVRYWNLFEEFKDSDGRQKILWGYPIVTVLLAIEGNLNGLEPFQKKLVGRAGGYTGHSELVRLRNGKTIKLPYDKAHLYLQRLRFLLVPEKPSPGDLPDGKTHTGGNLFQIAIKYGELEYYKEYFKDKIVIVGNSSPDAGDIHRTPVGDMAGMYILGNSIYTILAKEQPAPPPGWVSGIIEIVVIVSAAYLFLYFTSLLAQIIASALILIVFGGLSYWYFLNTGVFLNFVFAVVGMSFHETLKDVEEILEHKGRIAYDRKK